MQWLDKVTHQSPACGYSCRYICIYITELHLFIVLTLPPRSHKSMYQHTEGRVIYDTKLPFSGATLTSPSSFQINHC